MALESSRMFREDARTDGPGDHVGSSTDRGGVRIGTTTLAGVLQGVLLAGAAAALLAGLIAGSVGAALGDVQPLTLYQRVGRAPWIVLGEVTDGDDRFAQIKVVEVLKGSYARPDLRLIYRMENFLRKSWEERIEFPKGERAVFFLKRYEHEEEGHKVDEDLKAEDIFASVFGAQGKFALPEEGAPAYLEALREFVRTTSMADPLAQETALIAFLEAENPHVLQAGLEQIIERRLAADAQVPALMRLSDSPRDPVRLNALQALGQVAEDARSAKRPLPDQANVVSVLKGKVMGEGGDVYRVEALRVLATLAGEPERAFLERVSKEDRSQLVRYEAGRALVGLGFP